MERSGELQSAFTVLSASESSS